MTLEEAQEEIARLQGYMDNAAETIRDLQVECDRWHDMVIKLWVKTGATWEQLNAAGLQITIDFAD